MRDEIARETIGKMTKSSYKLGRGGVREERVEERGEERKRRSGEKNQRTRRWRGHGS